MNCPQCGAEMSPGLMIPGKNCDLEWAPGHWQFPFPRKGRVALKPPLPRDIPFDLPEYPAYLRTACRFVMFEYQ